MIKQIQLRGISRTPSDRMSEDGGLSESLNMYVDTAESAPAFVPEDVTAAIGLPTDISAERIFVHKTANYENFIAVQQGRIVAYTPNVKDDEPIILIEYTNETVNDITSVGNTVLVYTDKCSYFFLFAEGVYKFIGNKIPFPEIRFTTGEHTEVYTDYKAEYSNNDAWYDCPYDTINQVENASDDIDSYFNDNRNNFVHIFPSIAEWNSYGSSNSRRNIILEQVWANIYGELRENFPQYCSGAQIVRYAIRLYDDSLISSMPIWVNPKAAFSTAKIKWEQQHVRRLDLNGNLTQEGTTKMELSSTTPLYPIYANLANPDFYAGWEDIIKDIVFYAAPANLIVGDMTDSVMTSRNQGKKSVSNVDSFAISTSYKIDADVTLGKLDDVTLQNAIINSAEQTFMIMKLPFDAEKRTETINKLSEGLKLEFIADSAVLMTQDRLSGDDMAHNITLFKNALSFNNRIVAPAVTTQLIYDHHNLNSLDITKNEVSVDSYIRNEYDVAFLIKNALGQDLCVRKQFSYVDGTEFKISAFSYQTFPDSRCYKMLVQLKETFVTGASGMTSTYYGEFDMRPFPSLSCSYTESEYGKELRSLLGKDKPALWDMLDSYKSPVDEIKNKLYVSKQDNPFFFPIEGRYTFSSSVLSAAIATTALSQGQFGQFPLYVFTEDGIWAMETAADGSFVTSKPLSREVCSNPDSITSIDNAVVFVTKKAVMMISGSQVANISAYMNGRHYIPNESAQGVIGRQEGFAEFIPAVTDEDPFMLFMQDAKVAYDYTGERLVFISPSNKEFQYVYKVDTQTWHKVAFEGFDLVMPLNSYPECLVQGKHTETLKELVCLDNTSSHNTQTLLSMVQDLFPYEISVEKFDAFLKGNEPLSIKGMDISSVEEIEAVLLAEAVNTAREERTADITHVYDLSTILDASRKQDTAKGILITRPFDLGMPDVYKSITEIRIRGDYDKGNVKWLLQGSDNGRDFYTLTSLRGKSWKMFRIFILADLEPTERISWIDIDFEPRYNNRLR